MSETIALEGVTKKGRERIKRFGQVWTFTSKNDTKLWLKSLCGKDFRIIPTLAGQS